MKGILNEQLGKVKKLLVSDLRQTTRCDPNVEGVKINFWGHSEKTGSGQGIYKFLSDFTIVSRTL
jgi:hypothetical protein